MLTIHPSRISEAPVELDQVLPAAALELDEPTSRAKDPVKVRLTVQRDGENLIVTGTLETTLSLQCGRCAKWLDWPVKVDPFVLLLEAPLPDSIDLTPSVREDILLDLPAVAVCPPQNGKECRSYPQDSDAPGPIHGGDVWQELDKLKPTKKPAKAKKETKTK